MNCLYFQAHGLLNSCLVRCPDEEILIFQKELFDLEKQWYGGEHPLQTLENWRDLTGKHKNTLESIRAECKSRFQACGREVTSIKMDNIFSDANLEIAETFSNQVQNESEYCTNQMVDFAKEICKTSETLQKTPPPCSYTVVALGSISRGEATPYSDLEYAFIIQDSQHRPYFKLLAVDTYFRLSNLGETPLKYFYIKELYDRKGTKEQLWFIDKSPTGFRIDGLTPKAGNIPTGNGSTEDSLTFTVKELVERYKSSITASRIPGVIGDFAALLSTLKPVYSYDTNEQDGLEMLSDFLCEKMTFDSSDERLTTGLATIVDDVMRYSNNFCPEDLRVDMRNIEIKTHIFRYPTILAHDLKVALNLDGQTAWDIFREIYSQDMIDKKTFASLLFVLASAIWIRTSAYLQSGTQKEEISFHSVYDAQVANDRFYAPKKLYIAMACRLIPIKQKIMEVVPRTENVSIELGHIGEALRGIEAGQVDCILQARLHYTCGDYQGGLRHIRVGLRDDHVTDDIFTLMAGVEKDSYNAALLTAYLLFNCGHFDKAIHYFEQLYKIEEKSKNVPVKKATFRAMVAQCMVMLGQYQESKQEFDDAGRLLGGVLGISSRDDIANVWNVPFSEEHTDKENQIVLFACVSSRFLADSVRYHQGRYHKTRESFDKLLLTHLAIQLVMTDPPELNLVMADFHMSIGLYHLQFAEYAEAQASLTIAYDIYNRVFGRSAASLDLSSIYLHQGTLALKTGDYHKAKELGVLSLEILRKSGQSTSFHLLACQQMLAELYLVRGEYDIALRHIEDCFDIMRTSTTTSFVLQEAITHIIHAQIIHQQLTYTDRSHSPGRVDAKQWILNAIAALRTIVDPKARDSHPDICTALRILANICLDLGNTHEANLHAKKALEGSLKARGEGNAHPEILVSQLVLAKTLLPLEELSQMEGVLDSALRGFEKAYGENRAHPDVADAYHLLSELEAKRGAYEKAREYAANSVTTLKRVFGENSPHPILAAYERNGMQL